MIVNDHLVVGWTAEARAVTLALELAAGAEVKPREVAERFQVTRQTGYRMLDRLAGIMAIAPDDRGVWRLVDHNLERDATERGR